MNIQIIWYLLGVIVIHMMFGNTATYWFVLLVLFGSIITNIEKIKNFGGVSNG